MASIKDLISSLKKTKDKAISDNEGWFRGGKFTPGKQISEFRVGSNPTLGEAFNKVTSQGLNKAFNPYPRYAEDTKNNAFVRTGADIVNQGLKSYVNTGTFGLVQPKMGEQQTKWGTIGKIGGGIAGFTGGIGGKAMTGIDKLGQAGIMKFAPKLQTTLAGKIAGGLGKEALQTGAYMGGKYIAGKAGLRPDEKITGKSVLQDLAIGAAMRGITTPGAFSTVRKMISPDVWTSDRSTLNEALQRLKVGETIDEFSKIGKDIKNMYKEYGLSSYPNWDKLSQSQQVQVLSDRLDEMARSGFDIKMGITDQPIKTGGVSTPEVKGVIPEGKGIVWRSESGMDKNGVPIAGGNATSFSTTKELASQYGEAKPFQLTKQPKLVDISQLQPENQGGIIPYNIWTKIEQTGGARGSAMESFLKSNGFDGYKSGEEMVLLNRDIVKPLSSPSIPSVKTGGDTIKIKPNEDIVKQFDETIKVSEQPKIKVSNLETPKQPELKQRGFSASVQEAPDITKKTKIKVLGGYETKPNEQLMGEAKALLNEGVDLKNINKIENIDQKITAAMQEAINLDAQGQHEAAANLFNNLSDIGTELGRGVQSFSLISKMSPEAISLSAAGKIKQYNRTHKAQIPNLTGEQQKLISDQVETYLKMADGLDKNIALQRINETINSFIPSSLIDKGITVWKAGLLTSLRTHERNLLGNTIMQGSEIAKDVPGSWADYLMSLKTGQRTVMPSTGGTLSGAKQGLEEAGQTLKYGFNPNETLEKFDTKKITWNNNPLEQLLKKYTDTVFDTLAVEDKPFWQASYNRSLYQQSKVTANNQGKVDEKAILKLFNNPTEDMKILAIKDADYATFHDKSLLSNFATNMKRSLSKSELGKLVGEVTMPFTGVPTSVAGKTIDYSPIGLVKGANDFRKVMINDMPELQRQAAQELGRGTIGTALFALGGYLMSKGLMTGQPKDAKEAEQWKLEGKQANSVLIGGKWRSINSIGPQSLVMLAGAKYNEEMGIDGDGFGTYGMGLFKDQLSQTFLSGVQQPLQAITDPKRYAGGYVGGQVSSLIPNIVKDTSKAFDQTAREVDTGSFGGNITTSIQQNIPLWRNQMAPRRDVLGNPIAQEPTGLGAYFDLFNSKTPISNTVVDELARLNNEGYNASPSKLTKNQTISGVRMTLDQKDLDYYEQEAGKAVSRDLEALITSPVYQKLDDSDKKDMIDKQVTKTRKQVRAELDLIGMPDMGYKTSADAPRGIVEKAGVYGKSLITDPKQTIKAVIDGNPIRKVEGGIVILERKNALGSLDKGDQATEVDHIIAPTLGGTNDKSNLQILTKEENRAKGVFETYLYKEVKAGRMTIKEAREKDLNWREEILNMPEGEIKTLSNDIQRNATSEDSLSGLVFKVVSDSGTPAMVDIGSEIEQPEYTGQAELDKKLKSAYKTSLTKRITDIVKVYESGQITAEEAEKLIAEIKQKQGKSGGGSGKIKVGTLPTFKAPTIKIKSSIPKVSVNPSGIKISMPKTSQSKIKLPTFKKANLANKTVKVKQFRQPVVKIKNG